MVIGTLLAPLDYLRIQQSGKRWFDLWVPLGLAVTGTACIALFSVVLCVPFNVFGEFGLVHGGSGLLQILVGFYIAALAAVATFNRPGIDDPMSGDDPPVLPKHDRADKPNAISRRRFLCLLFGYLALLGLFLYLIGVGSLAAAPGLKLAMSVTQAMIARIAFCFLYLFLFANLFVTTLLGLYFMADRIHRLPPQKGIGAQTPKTVEPPPPSE